MVHTFILVQRLEDQKSFEVSLDSEFEVSLNYNNLFQNKEIMKHLVFYDGSALWYSCFDSVIVTISELTLVLMTWEHSSNAHHLVAAIEHNALVFNGGHSSLRILYQRLGRERRVQGVLIWL